MINGFWMTVPVAVASSDGRVVGAFFTYHGGDLMDEGTPQVPEPVFTTDEGLVQPNVTHWSYLPKHPKDLI